MRRLLGDADELSLDDRIAGDDGGVVVTEAATCSWTLDGGTLHCYDFAGDVSAAAALTGLVAELGRMHLATVLVVVRYAGDPWLDALEASGFERDWSEAEVREGKLTALVGLVRVVE